MLITVLSATVETVPTTKGSYQKLELAFKGEEGQVKGKKIMSFGTSAAAFKVLAKAQNGETYEITTVKNESTGYWDWTGASKSTGTTPSSTSPGTSQTSLGGSKSSYETPEERARKQVYIVRQSSLATAVTFLEGKSDSVEDVIQTAKQFETYVFGIGETPKAAHAFSDFVGDEDQIL